MGVVRANQKAKISFRLADNSEREIECSIREVLSDRLVLNFPPQLITYASYLLEGTEVPVRIFTPCGVKAFDSMILNSPLESDFIIEYIEGENIIQRREFLRGTLDTKIIIERNDEQNIVTRTIDIGGGGVRFLYDGDFRQEEEVTCRLYLPFELNSVVAKGNILNTPHLPDNQKVVKFHVITEKDRDKIIKRCFDLQSAVCGDLCRIEYRL